jgi:hypothetical protein
MLRFRKQLRFPFTYLLALCFVTLAACSRSDGPAIKIGFGTSEESVRQQLLKITPAGTPLAVALRFAQQEAPKHEIGWCSGVVGHGGTRRRWEAGRFSLEWVGVKSFTLSFRVRELLDWVTAGVMIDYAFNGRDELLDITVKITSSPWLP